MSPVKEVLEKALDLDEHDRAKIIEALFESLEPMTARQDRC
jgi:hypothetical protein